jgi:hypothetical protein
VPLAGSNRFDRCDRSLWRYLSAIAHICFSSGNTCGFFPLSQGSIDRAEEPAIAWVDAMFLVLAIILVVLWIGGFIMFKTAGVLIHLLLLFAVISLILHFVNGRRSA